MMKIVWTMLLLAGTLFAAEITLPASFTAGFVQTVTNSKGKVIRYKGKVQFSRPKLLKWSYVEPTRKEVCTDGNEVLVVDHDLEQVSAYRIDEGLDLAHILQKAKPYKERIYVTDYQGKQYTIQLDAKARLQSVAFYDDLDNKVQILFTQMHYSQKSLPRAQMKCNYPADYDVIRG